jgi:hypothetical protein
MVNKISNDFSSRRRNARIWEYRVYFALIFLVGLFPATIHCFLARLGVLERSREWNGIVRCAWDKARAYTPMIFSA